MCEYSSGHRIMYKEQTGGMFVWVNPPSAARVGGKIHFNIQPFFPEKPLLRIALGG